LVLPLQRKHRWRHSSSVSADCRRPGCTCRVTDASLARHPQHRSERPPQACVPFGAHINGRGLQRGGDRGSLNHVDGHVRATAGVPKVCRNACGEVASNFACASSDSAPSRNRSPTMRRTASRTKRASASAEYGASVFRPCRHHALRRRIGAVDHDRRVRGAATAAHRSLFPDRPPRTQRGDRGRTYWNGALLRRLPTTVKAKPSRLFVWVPRRLPQLSGTTWSTPWRKFWLN